MSPRCLPGCRGGDGNWCLFDAKTPCPHLHLIDGFFAGDVGAARSFRQARCDLQQKRRFSDRVPPIRMAEPRTRPPPVTRSNSSIPVCGAVPARPCRQGRHIDRPAAPGAARVFRRSAQNSNFFDDRIPFATSVTPAHPSRMDGPTGRQT